MRKTTALMLSFLMTVSLAACSGAILLKGKLLNGGGSEDTLKKWVKDLKL